MLAFKRVPQRRFEFNRLRLSLGKNLGDFTLAESQPIKELLRQPPENWGLVGRPLVELEIGVDDFSNSSYDLIYKMTNETTGKPLAMVKTRMVCFDYSDRKVQNVPSDFINLFK